VPDRCFVAVELPKCVRSALLNASESFRDAAPAWRDEKWVVPDLLHVTLAFLGPVPDGDVPFLLEALRDVGTRHAAFDLHLSGARAVPSGHHALMVWALLEGDVEPASVLHDLVLEAAGREPDPRPFRPHVTLVRSRRPRRVHHEALADLACALAESGKTRDGVVSVPSLTVLSSTLGVGGPAYRSLGVIPLADAAGQRSAD
jgi:RNA 2',3'-cyclic 3'-phosphodiesterase